MQLIITYNPCHWPNVVPLTLNKLYRIVCVCLFEAHSFIYSFIQRASKWVSLSLTEYIWLNFKLANLICLSYCPVKVHFQWHTLNKMNKWIMDSMFSLSVYNNASESDHWLVCVYVCGSAVVTVYSLMITLVDAIASFPLISIVCIHNNCLKVSLRQSGTNGHRKILSLSLSFTFHIDN